MALIYTYINVKLIHDTQKAQISQKQYGCNIYAIMKTMFPTKNNVPYIVFMITYILRPSCFCEI